MEWLSQLFKHFRDSRVFTGAVFVTCVVILYGNYLLPDSIPELPSNIKLIATAGLVFTGTLVLLGIVPGIVSALKNWVITAKQYFGGLRVSHLKQVIILVISNQPDESFNLYELEFESDGITPIAAFEAASALEAKGYVSINRYHRRYIKLTIKGRKMAHKARMSLDE